MILYDVWNRDERRNTPSGLIFMLITN